MRLFKVFYTGNDVLNSEQRWVYAVAHDPSEAEAMVITTMYDLTGFEGYYVDRINIVARTEDVPGLSLLVLSPEIE